MTVAEKEAIKLTAMLLTAENWATLYTKTPKQHAQIIKNEATLQVVLTRYFGNLAKHANHLINWDQYNHQKLDFNVDVIVNETQLDQFDQDFIQLTLHTVTDTVAAGAQAGEELYKIPLGIQSTDEIIKNLGLKQVAALIGKKVTPDGKIIDNPNADYNIIDTVRNDIANSIKGSLAAGDDMQEATAKIAELIGDPSRAARIARTEAVNAYNAGITEFGNQSGAVGMEWEDAGAEDECADYADQGPIPIDSDWDGMDGPPAHPNCRCAKRLIYQDEWDGNGYGDGNSGNSRPDFQSPDDAEADA